MYTVTRLVTNTDIKHKCKR